MNNFFQIEIAGVAITLTDEDAALVVYADRSLNNMEVSFDGPNGDRHSEGSRTSCYLLGLF